MRTIRTGTAVLLFVVVTISAAVAPAAAAADAPTASIQDNETTTATETATTDSAECEPGPDEPQLQQARLYSPQPTITSDQEGRVSGEITLDIQNECPVRVQLSLSIPNGMYIQGSNDISSGGGGTVTSTFVIQPGETKSLRAEVYSQTLGERTVTADITYHPVGHRDMAREIDGQMMTFDVEEENWPDGNVTEGSGGDGGDDGSGDDTSMVEKLYHIVGATQIGLLVLVALGMVLIGRAYPDTLNVENIFRKK